MREGVVLCDAHTHVGTEGERREREEKEILSLVCASAPMEAETVFLHMGKYRIPTCGVHPWYAEKWGFDSMAGWMERCQVIGEIGMDSVWCSVPLRVQEDVFRRQLDMACRQGKPVILHTKGQEENIARIIREYPNRYLVHWYSCENYLEEYVSQDCYFSIGPDVWWNRAVRDMVRKVPGNRLLTETDGLEAVRWAYEEGRKALAGEPGKNVGCREETDSKTGLRPKAVRDLEGNLAEEPEPGRESIAGVEGAETALMATLETAAELLGMKPEDAGRMFKENLVGGFLGGLKL